jgi:hypothetical protein
MQSCEFKPQENSTIKNHINVQDQLKTIEVSVLISGICIASFCHVYLKFPLNIKDSTFFS